VNPTALFIVSHLDRGALRRIFSKIRIDPDTDCWLWTGARLKSGYGLVRLGPATAGNALVHRLMWAWLVGPLPRGRGRKIPQLDHVVCERKACCNPIHLKLVSLRVNLLRGDSPPAVNHRRLVCRKGHALPLKPNAVGPQGPYRLCVVCRLERGRRTYRLHHRRALAYAAKYRARRRHAC
jgi:hypothetical protein